MEKEFTFDSDYFEKQYIVVIEIDASSHDEAECTSINIFDENNQQVKLGKFPQHEQEEIERIADKTAMDYAVEAYQGKMVYYADMKTDEYRGK